ncbi:MAG: M23 family metallopeptidase [Paludibacteraceae bacterium]|nr:M23 family metallopeptidase [Paludibacteraceae bacterium]MBR2492372.1 M23 family metallopeptidase [Paludibacteraceae bacterium]MBR6686172.1 M23 family metallopeptidase [Paludibacteraceae bacterium]
MKSASRLSFFQKIKMKYKISVLNENTLEEVFHLRMSAQRFFFTFLLILLIVLILFSTLILTTPLRQLLPDNISSDFRKEAVRHALVIDSLTEEVTVRQAYINTLRDLVAGNIAITDSIFYSDSIIVKEHDEPLLDKSQTEKEFCEEFEEEERYNISATTNNPNNNLVFFKPTIGEIDKPFDPVNGHLGIDITTKPSTPIVSIYQGIVLYSAYTLDEDYFIQVIHPQGFISVYKGAANVFKKSGDIVQSGEVIAIMGEDSSKSLHFELWRDSQAQNPLNYIVFE